MTRMISVLSYSSRAIKLIARGKLLQELNWNLSNLFEKLEFVRRIIGIKKSTTNPILVCLWNNFLHFVTGDLQCMYMSTSRNSTYKSPIPTFLGLYEKNYLTVLKIPYE